MTIHLSPGLEQMLRERMASGKYASEEELLREALLSLADQDADEEAIDQAIAEYQNGDPGVPLDDAVERIRRKHPLPRPA